MGVIGPGHSGNVLSFERCAAKLKKTGFEGATAIEIDSMVPGAAASGRDYLLMAKHIKVDDYEIAFIVGRASVVTLSHDSMLPIVRTLVGPLNPAYGTGFFRDHRRGPESYVVGINRGGLTESVADVEEKRKVSFWVFGMDKQVWRQGLLRDVYPWNFLTRPHLEKQVSGLSLEDWVRQDTRRGSLIPLGGTTLWEVSPPELAEVKQVLWDAGAIHRPRSAK